MTEEDILITRGKNRLVVHFASRVELINRVEEETRSFLKAHGLEEKTFPICLAMREGLLNAVQHGNRHDPSKTVKYTLQFSDGILTLEVEDEGEGFDWRSIKHVCPSGKSEHGRGIFIIRQNVSSYQYNDQGNKLLMTKVCHTRQERKR